MNIIRFIAVLVAAALMWPGPAGAERGRKMEPKGPEILNDEFLERLERRLELKGKQMDKVESVVKDARPGIKKKWSELQKLQKRVEAVAKKLRNSMREVQEKIREQLDYDQREKFDEMRVRQKRRRSRDVPQEMRERMERKRKQEMERRRERPSPRDFPPERFEMDVPGNRPRDLPPELQERIRERRQRRMDMEPGYQRDVPPVEEWNDRHRRFFNDDRPDIRPDDDE